ncbi:phosphoribosylformylglycinamidine synthase subunit PurL [Ehrlichia canis]|uniref:Phosphoribosylformylglycinamidine synthase subunit II n=1 Tax=Ehrlichia canis (strain Jake) TaxID=269484 RepID=A0ACA6AW58_EHRCJ|nr:phosphoribosylformylglycinamidine synthase subunit PurL [Ehrlichia canis]AAZ68690.1 phosphoribosylformylglycinamidine synthase subunit II [Ehrlichia canis str. Jake]AUO54577.1 phosphoribosylformylglycinamidine synthase subunit PurL [Ehrlichia canis]UKC52986.1 purL [Ehrlichia canis]UKC53923.1 purL [Ehrlichia canis]UKC54859.1 purL [Ehrlichia canis]
MIIRIGVIDKVLPEHYMRTNATVYTIDIKHHLNTETINKIGSLLTNPITQKFFAFIYDIRELNYKEITHNTNYNLLNTFKATWSLEKGFLPRVTDNVGNTTKCIINEALGNNSEVSVFTSQVIFGQEPIPQEDEVSKLFNSLIEYCKLSIAKGELFQVQFFGNKQILDLNKIYSNPSNSIFLIPYIKHEHLFPQQKAQNTYVTSVDLNIQDHKLIQISKHGINNRGPLNLSLEAMKAIQAYFKKIQRNPNDIELETLAQTWSEHCKHNIFSSPIDEITDGLYKHYIKRATQEINSEICVSTFSDNAGAIIFDDNFIIADKVETHNSPSALDPFGGAITGILGVNRDIIGFGKGAKPILNAYYFCFSESEEELYRDKSCTVKVLPSDVIMDGVIKGVNSGGNCSGIPTSLGSAYFDDRFRSKPLVFVGCTGIMPRTINNALSHLKKPNNGDFIVIAGGRTGRDGIHGATFSSNALTEHNSSSTVVQIGDPITQKKLSDAIIKEARDLDLYNAITDNGAGGLSSSVGEMGNNGFRVELDKVLLKHDNMLPWEIWVSESQERMTFAVPPNKFTMFEKVMKKHDVEISIIGEFNNTNKAVVLYKGSVIMDMDVDFLHNGVPKIHLQTNSYTQTIESIPNKKFNKPLAVELNEIIQRMNICSKEFISLQYDHEVQGTSVIKPLQGKGRVNGDATVIRPILSSNRGIVKSQGLGSSYGEISTYHMAACAIDTAIRNYVAVGGNFNHLALLDNFCWCDSTNPQRLWQLKNAAKACYDYAVAFKTPFISGKDSMFNDFKGYNKKGEEITISAPPSLLISTIGIIENVENAVTLDVKSPGDLIYILGITYNELGGSEYQKYTGIENNNVPQVHAEHAKKLYTSYNKAISANLIASAIAINLGGIIISLVKSLIGGQLGAEISLSSIPICNIENNHLQEKVILFSESQSRILVTVNENKKQEFETIFKNIPHANIGKVTSINTLIIDNMCSIDLNMLEYSYKKFSNMKIQSYAT